MLHIREPQPGKKFISIAPKLSKFLSITLTNFFGFHLDPFSSTPYTMEGIELLDDGRKRKQFFDTPTCKRRLVFSGDVIRTCRSEEETRRDVETRTCRSEKETRKRKLEGVRVHRDNIKRMRLDRIKRISHQNIKNYENSWEYIKEKCHFEDVTDDEFEEESGYESSEVVRDNICRTYRNGKRKRGGSIFYKKIRGATMSTVVKKRELMKDSKMGEAVEPIYGFKSPDNYLVSELYQLCRNAGIPNFVTRLDLMTERALADIVTRGGMAGYLDNDNLHPLEYCKPNTEEEMDVIPPEDDGDYMVAYGRRNTYWDMMLETGSVKKEHFKRDKLLELLKTSDKIMWAKPVLLSEDEFLKLKYGVWEMTGRAERRKALTTIRIKGHTDSRIDVQSRLIREGLTHTNGVSLVGLCEDPKKWIESKIDGQGNPIKKYYGLNQKLFFVYSLYKKIYGVHKLVEAILKKKKIVTSYKKWDVI